MQKRGRLRNLFCCILALAVISVFCSSAARAEGNIKIGNAEVHPFILLEQKYDDNIFLEDANENNDWITTASPGFEMIWPLIAEREDDFLVKTQYTANIIEFWDSSEQSRFDHKAKATLDLNFSNNFTLDIKEDFLKTADPPNSELTAFEKRSQNTAEIIPGYAGEKLGISAGYKNIKDDYNTQNNLDRFEHVGTLEVSQKVASKTDFFGEYNYGKIIYDESTTNSDSKYHQFRIGVEGDLWPKFSGIIKGGYKESDYSDSSKEDFASCTLYGKIAYAATERCKIGVYGERASEESSYGTNSYFELNKIGFDLTHQLLDRLSLLGEASYQLSKYPDATTEGGVTDEREDDLWDVKLGLKYTLKEDMCFMGMGYEYKERDSNFATYDYGDNKVTTTLSLLF